MILLINICKEKLHYLEFVKPTEDILRLNKITFFTKGYKEVQQKDLEKCEKVIICGTSLKDNEFIEDAKTRFSWIKSFQKPLLGICGGMQIIGKVYGANVGKKTEIGFFKEIFDKEFLGLKDEQEVYHLHNNFIYLPMHFENYNISEVCQAIKHKEKEIYGVLFHPEVRQKSLIKGFSKL
ncbi:MAG: hypothetical protein AABX17_02225 [Nanoarchaeota archaeon]